MVVVFINMQLLSMLGYSFLNIFRKVDTVSHAGSTEKDVVFASKTCPVWAGETEKQKLESSSVMLCLRSQDGAGGMRRGHTREGS